MLVYFGLAAGTLSALAYLPYIVDTVAGRTRPQRASWLIWSVLGSVALASQIYEGATTSLWFAGAQVGGTLVVFLLSIFLGRGTYLTRADYLTLGLASVGLALWYMTETAAYALGVSISISLLGGAATLLKAYRAPGSETMMTWAMSFVATICALAAVGAPDPLLIAYPVYLCVLNGTIVGAILLGRATGRMAPATRADLSLA